MASPRPAWDIQWYSLSPKKINKIKIFFFYYFIIHMCIQGLGHFSPRQNLRMTFFCGTKVWMLGLWLAR
jgi:hypothetical protein